MQTGGDTTAGRIAALENIVPALERLEGLLVEAKAQPAEFDLLQIIRPGLWQYEVVHSNIIAWLLDPQQSHGLGQYFLKNFLLRTCHTAEMLGTPAITPSMIHSIDWLGTKVCREWRYIDILVLNRKSRFVCAIENKIFASEWIGDSGISQLTSYRTALDQEFPDFAKHLVFLDLKFERPSENERPHWTPENYKTVLELVEQTIEHKATALSEDVSVFLRQYAITLRKRGKVVPESNDIAQLVREIYLEHREAIELMIQHKPDFVEEAKEMFKAAIRQQDDWELDREVAAGLVGFRHAKWKKFDVFETGSGWSSKALVLFDFDFREDGKVMLILTISPGNEESARRRLFEAVQRTPTFDSKGHRFGRWSDGYIRLHVSESILDGSDFDNWGDQERIRTKIEEWVVKFAENEFPAMNEVIVNCLREYEAEQAAQ